MKRTEQHGEFYCAKIIQQRMMKYGKTWLRPQTGRNLLLIDCTN